MWKMSNYRYLLAMLITFAAHCVQAQVYNEADTDWPSLPLVEITTVNGAEPTATALETPEGCVGNGIVSEYVPGRIVISLDGKTTYDSGDYAKGESGMRIKIRGNTSGMLLDQKPYKIKLSKKADLLNRGIKDCKDKNWALLSWNTMKGLFTNDKSNILPLVGLAVCRFLGQTWTPAITPANVVMNGNYKGLYYLVETVERSDRRVAVSKSGFLIENDAYWWKPGETFFKTLHQARHMGYTFKYPDPDEVTENEIDAVHRYMEKAEEAIFKADGTAAGFIDYQSFARWILGHDILGTVDSGGSNMFIYKEGLDNTEPGSSKLMMATLWDFDTSLKEGKTGWSTIHNSNEFYYPQLFKDPAFVSKYLEQYNANKDKVCGLMEEYLNKLNADNGEAIRQSMELHSRLYPSQCKYTLDEQIDNIMNVLRSRMSALANLTKTLETETGLRNASVGVPRLLKRSDLYGNDFTSVAVSQLPKSVYVETYSDGTVRKMCR